MIHAFPEIIYIFYYTVLFGCHTLKARENVLIVITERIHV